MHTPTFHLCGVLGRPLRMHPIAIYTEYDAHRLLGLSSVEYSVNLQNDGQTSFGFLFLSPTLMSCLVQLRLLSHSCPLR
jgi:hypothetical protein